MTDATTLNFSEADLPENVTADAAFANRFTQAALANHKREGVELAVRMRWIAMAVVSVLLIVLNPEWGMLYYHAILLVFCLLGWVHQRVARVGRSRAELVVLAADVFVFVFALTFPNPFVTEGWPTALVYEFENFSFLFILLATGTLAYSWRTIMAIGVWTSIAWVIAALLIWWFGFTDPAYTIAAQETYSHWPDVALLMDPNLVGFDQRLQQVVLFLLVAGILAVSVRRFNRLLINNAVLARERENLSRYFSPNVVEELSHNDEPLKTIRSHDVAVIFVDIHGFTRYASTRRPEDVIGTLREFHGQMERAVFAQNGTLDKYLGDGLMATFGTPLPSPDDVRRAYHCARRMVDLSAEWNTQRKARGEEELTVSVGLHYGPVVLGDIGGNRLEFAVIGNTVNVASRLEGLTRSLKSRLVISEDVFRRLPQEETQDLQPVADQEIRGIDGVRSVWTLP